MIISKPGGERQIDRDQKRVMSVVVVAENRISRHIQWMAVVVVLLDSIEM